MNVKDWSKIDYCLTCFLKFISKEVKNVQIGEDSRQMPKTKDYMSNKKYCDILYAYLQTISSWDGVVGHPRVFSKKEKNFQKISEIIGKSRQTVSKKFNTLLELGLVKEREDSYELIVLEKDLASLIPLKTLRVLVNAMSENAISIYIYLLNRYYAILSSGKTEFMFTLSQLKGIIGISSNTRSNDYIINDILTILEKIGLIKVDIRQIEDQYSGDMKSTLYITNVSNSIE